MGLLTRFNNGVHVHPGRTIDTVILTTFTGGANPVKSLAKFQHCVFDVPRSWQISVAERRSSAALQF